MVESVDSYGPERMEELLGRYLPDDKLGSDPRLARGHEVNLVSMACAGESGR
jgi:hypothetical protein